MQIVLICRDVSGSASFPAEMIEGIAAPARRYEIASNQIVLEGYDDIVLHHDADALLAMPGDLYRMQTPAEQNAASKASRKAKTVEEVAPFEAEGI